MTRGATAELSLEDRSSGQTAPAPEAAVRSRSTAAERAPHLSATLLSPVDIGVITAALLAATVVRHHPLLNPLWTAAGLPILAGSWWSPAQTVLLLVQVLAIPFALAALGQYRTSAGRLPDWSFEKVVAVITVTHIVAMAAIYVVRLGYIPRGVMILDYLFLLVGLTGWRINWEQRAMKRLASGEGRRNVLIVGRGPLVDRVTHTILDDPHHGRRIVGYLATYPAEPFETLPNETFERSDVWAPWLGQPAKAATAFAGTIVQKTAHANGANGAGETNGHGTNGNGTHGNGTNGHATNGHGTNGNGTGGGRDLLNSNEGKEAQVSTSLEGHGATALASPRGALDVGPAAIQASRLTPAIVENVLNQPLHLLATVGTTEHDAVVQTLDGLCVEEVFIAPDIPREEVSCVVRACRVRGVDVHIIPAHYQELGVQHEPWKLGEFTMMGLYKRPISQFGWVAKRAMDIVAAAAGLLIASPILLASAIAIKIEHPTLPVFYRSTRIGFKANRFPMVKLTTMRPDAQQLEKELMADNQREGPWFKLDADHDPRLTRVGRVLRALSINEIPQLWNVFVGDMSLVGPRPPIPEEVATYVDYDFRYYRCLDVKPGITGLWQVTARDDPSFDLRIDLDLQYIHNWSLWLDVKIMFKTVTTVLFHRED